MCDVSGDIRSVDRGQEKELDEVDGALFSRISHEKKCLSDKNDLDDCDGAQFSRINSAKDNSSKTKPFGTGPITLSDTDACTATPEDMDTTFEPEQKVSEVSKPASSKKKNRKPNKDNNIKHCKDVYDVEDAPQGSRSLPSLQQAKGEQCVRTHSSTFYCNEPDLNDKSEAGDPGFPVLIENKPVSEKNKPEFTLGEQNDQNAVGEGESTEIFVCDQDAHIQSCSSPESQTIIEQIPLVTGVTNHIVKTKPFNNQGSFRWRVVKGLTFPLVGLLIYFWDIGSDIKLAAEYRSEGKLDLFGITIACIIIPHILMAIVDVSWVWMDKGCKEPLRLILGVLTLGRIVRSYDYMRNTYYAKKLPKDPDSADTTQYMADETNIDTSSPSKPVPSHEMRKWYKDLARSEKRDCFMLDFINAFLESAPQLFVQLYLYYSFNLELSLTRVLNLLSSWASIAWTYAAYYRCNREALKGKEDVTFVGFAFFFTAFLAALAVRVICIVLFFVHPGLKYGAIPVGVHFIAMFIWIACKEKPPLVGTTTHACGRYLYYVFFAYVCILGFMNLQDTKARVRITLFYLLMYVESFALAAAPLYRMSESDNFKFSIHLAIIVVGCIVHVILLTNYYLLLHPTSGQCYNCERQKDNASVS